MLKQLRENTKTILWIVVVAFIVSIFAVWGANLRRSSNRPAASDNSVGEVNGVKIDRMTYQYNLQQLYDNIRQQRGDDFELSDNERYILSRQAWETTVQKAILAREIRKLGITVTDDELVSFLRRNPHPSLRKMFTDEDGNFDYQKYLEALSDPKADWTELEKWGRSVLPEIKLETFLSSQVDISDREVHERFERKYTSMAAVYVRVPYPESEIPYEPSESEIDSLYNENKDDYVEAEKRQIKVIELDKTPTARDVEDAKERADEIMDEIRGGMDFAEAAKIESDDNMTAEKGGDLGFFTRDAMDSVFAAAAFSLKPGEIGGPVKTRFGYHIIKTEEKKTEDGQEKVRARHILVNIEPGNDTVDSLKTLLTDLRDLIRDKGFEKAADQMNLEITEPEPFTRGAFIGGLGYLPRVVDFAFGNSAGTVSGPIENKETIYFVKIVKEIPERTMTLDDVRSQVVAQIRRDRRSKLARKRAEKIRSDAVIGGDLESAAHAAGLQVEETPEFTLDESIPGIGQGTGFAEAAYMLPAGKISPPVKGNDEWFILKVEKRTPPDEKDLADKTKEIVQELRQEKSSEFIALWYDELRQKAEVKDWRERAIK